VLHALLTRSFFFTLSWTQWAALLAAGAVLGISGVIAKIWFSARRRARRLTTSLSESFTPEEKLRYAELNRLAASTDPEERKKGRELYKEYQERLRAITGTLDQKRP
jgi:hypothetical protein